MDQDRKGSSKPGRAVAQEDWTWVPPLHTMGGGWGSTLRTGLWLQSTMHHGSMDPSQIIHSNCTVERGWGRLGILVLPTVAAASSKQGCYI